jgi:hypothetical protein
MVQPDVKAMLVDLLHPRGAPPASANDNRRGSERMSEVAIALRGVFPDITPIQARQAARQLAACCGAPGRRPGGTVRLV